MREPIMVSRSFITRLLRYSLFTENIINLLYGTKEMTDEEADALDEYYTKNPPKVDPSKNGGFAKKSFRMVALDRLSEDYL